VAEAACASIAIRLAAVPTGWRSPVAWGGNVRVGRCGRPMVSCSGMPLAHTLRSTFADAARLMGHHPFHVTARNSSETSLNLTVSGLSGKITGCVYYLAGYPSYVRRKAAGAGRRYAASGEPRRPSD
jgi:hypothetical protein